jgi:predicted short-subunit dehydrogenase-like oxidoreductase (DUF2520 family)
VKSKAKVQSSKFKVQSSNTGRGDLDANRPVSPSSRKPSSSRQSPTRSSRKSSASSSRRSVAIVGAGRLGTALASALDACGYEVRALVSRGASGARRAAARAGLKTLALGAGELERLPSVELLFVTTPDDVLGETVASLASLTDARARVALHTSGALSSELLAPLRARGYQIGSMHPLAAVSETRAGARSLRHAFYCVEGEAAAVRAARRVVRDLGGRSFTIAPEDKALYHAAALITAGHTVALFDLAAALLARCGLSELEARRVLLPLLQSAVENLSRQPPERALTGTFARGDALTVRKHLAALASRKLVEAMSVYVLLGRHSLHLAEKNGADAKAIRKVISALAQADEGV